ncbi:MAG: carbon-nitrogen hydrolase family protein [Streptosporangiaceae bacterium]
MRALLAAIECQKGDVDGNLAVHLDLLGQADGEGCDLVLFPEMSLTGSADPGSGRLIRLDHPAVQKLVTATADLQVAGCFGIAEQTTAGMPHITQVVAAGGKVLGVQRKRHLGEGEESFTAGTGAAIFGLAGARFGVAICAEAGFDDPFDDAAAGGAGLVLFPAAPGLYGRRTDEASWRTGFDWWQGCGLGDARRHARRLGLWIALAGQAGSTVDEDFPGLAALVRPDGTIAARLPDWRAGTLSVDIAV